MTQNQLGAMELTGKNLSRSREGIFGKDDYVVVVMLMRLVSSGCGVKF